MAIHHGIDWEKVERRVLRLRWMMVFSKVIPGARVFIDHGQPKMTVPVSVYVTPWQWVKARKEVTLREAIDMTCGEI